MDFKLKDGEVVRTVKCLKGSSVVIEPGDLVVLASGLIVKAGATAAAIAWCPNGAANGTTEVEVTVGNDFTLLGTGDGVFDVNYKGTAVDLAGTTNLVIDVTGGTTYKVLKFGIDKDTGVVGSAANIAVRINAPLF
jgi:hypothetical protein